MATSSRNGDDGEGGTSVPPSSFTDQLRRRRRRRAAGEPTVADNDHKISLDADVLDWVRNRTRRGWTTDKIIEASRRGGDGWPERWPKGLSDSTVSGIRTAIYHLEQAEKLNPRKRAPRYSGKRMREVVEKRKKPNHEPLVDVQYRVMQLTSVLDSIDLDDYDLDADAQETADLYEDLVELQFWMDLATGTCETRLDDAKKLETIRKLREGTNGRTEDEIKTALRLADKLEEKFQRRIESRR